MKPLVLYVLLPGPPVTRWNCISVIKLKLINNNVPSLQTGSSWKAWWRRSSGNPGRPCEYLSLNHIFYLPYRYLDKILIWWLFLGRSRSERSHRWGRASGSAGKNNIHTDFCLLFLLPTFYYFVLLIFFVSLQGERGPAGIRGVPGPKGEPVSTASPDLSIKPVPMLFHIHLLSLTSGET